MVPATRPMSCLTLPSLPGVPSLPRKYFEATLFVAVWDQNEGSSPFFCWKIVCPLWSVMTPSRISHFTASYGRRPGFVYGLWYCDSARGTYGFCWFLLFFTLLV